MNGALLSLLQLSDPALPIGGYAHSGGLETYVQEGVVCDRRSAGRFVRDMLSANVYYRDAALAGWAHSAVCAGDHNRLMELHRLCGAVKMPKEIGEASRKLGGRLLKIFGAICDRKGSGPAPRHYTVAFGYCAAVLGIGLREAVSGCYYNAAAGMESNCGKVLPMGQQDVEELLFDVDQLIAG